MSDVAATTSFEITDRAYPVRCWWLKRSVLACLALAVLLAAFRAWWGHSAHRRLETALTALRADGQPVSIEDLQPADVPDAANSVVLWNQAMAAINSAVVTPAQSNLDYVNYPPWSAAWHQTLESGVGGNAPALALARQARSRSQVNWKINFASPLANTLLPSLNSTRNLANVIGDAALHAHLHGDDFEALERIRDLRRLANDVDQQPFLISHMVSVGLIALTAVRVEIIAPDLLIEGSSSPTTRPGGRAATREQIHGLIADFLAAADDPRPTQRAIASERVSSIDNAQVIARRAPLTRPMFDLANLRDIEDSSAAILAANEPTSATTNAMLSALPQRNVFMPAFLTTPFPTKVQTPRLSQAASFYLYGRYLQMDYRIRLEMRFAAIGLAAQLYRADHGDWPGSLDALMPKYLPKIPVDPFSTDSQPIRYLLAKGALPDGRDRPLIYSGLSGYEVDETFAPRTPQYDWAQSGMQFRDLARWSPAPTTRPADDGQ